MTKFQFELGKQARDKITGFKGIIVGRSEFIFGCNRYGLSPKVGKDGRYMESEWFDEGRIVIIGKGVSPETVKVKKPGADGRKSDDPR